MQSDFDPAITALVSQLKNIAKTEAHAWIADEHPLPENFYPVASSNSTTFFTNRYDQHMRAQGHSITSHFTDMEFAPFRDNPLQHIFFRVAKERAVVHRVINESRRVLAPGATLWLAGHKNEGIKTHISRAEECLSSEAQIQRYPNQLFIASITNTDGVNLALDDKNYGDLRSVTVGEDTFISKPGLYGWNKIDQGSRLLMEHMRENTDALSGKQVLDLGCGYGYISMRALEKTPAKIVSTDNCFAALTACEANLSKIADTAKKAIRYEVLPSDAGEDIEGTFDTILCNPPFHQGFSTTPLLHKKFLTNTRRLLSRSGASWYVLNQFLNIDQLANQEGLNVELVSKTGSYKIIKMTHK